jgi:hypothetical protein
MLRRIFTFENLIISAATLLALTVYNQDAGSGARLMNIAPIVVVLVLCEIASSLKKIHQLLLLQNQSIVDQAIASLEKQRGQDSI